MDVKMMKSFDELQDFKVTKADRLLVKSIDKSNNKNNTWMKVNDTTYKPDLINGLPGLLFNSSGFVGNLISNDKNILKNINKTISFIMIINLSDVNMNNSKILCIGDETSENCIMLYVNNNTINLSKNSMLSKIKLNPGPNIILVSYNRQYSYLSINGGDQIITPLNNTIINFEKYSIGLNINNGKDTFTGVIGEIIFFVNNNDKHKQFEGYLAWKWNIISQLPDTHECKNNINIEKFFIEK